MKTKLNTAKNNTNIKKKFDFDTLVKELRVSNKIGCCSGEKTCNIQCSPLNGGCGDKGDGECC